jgi:hypothetical protein
MIRKSLYGFVLGTTLFCHLCYGAQRLNFYETKHFLLTKPKEISAKSWEHKRSTSNLLSRDVRMYNPRFYKDSWSYGSESDGVLYQMSILVVSADIITISYFQYKRCSKWSPFCQKKTLNTKLYKSALAVKKAIDTNDQEYLRTYPVVVPTQRTSYVTIDNKRALSLHYRAREKGVFYADTEYIYLYVYSQSGQLKEYLIELFCYIDTRDKRQEDVQKEIDSFKKATKVWLETFRVYNADFSNDELDIDPSFL